MAVKTGIVFEIALALISPSIFTPYVKNIKAIDDANIASAINGYKIFMPISTVFRWSNSNTNRKGRKKTAPKRF